jgi:hypothetical protein
MPKNRIVLHFAPNGDLLEIAADAECEVYYVEERCPNDRVYRFSRPSLSINSKRVEDIIGDSPIGTKNWMPGKA